MAQQLTGLHHLTAITARARENLRFYTGTLGMRLVKKTVNQDDTSAWHLFYADGEARPGTDVTFFDWPAARERRGTGAVSRTGLRVAPGGLDFWAARLREAGAPVGDLREIGGRPSLDFEDPEGQRLRLVEDDGPADPRPWADSPVPAALQILGLGPITLSVAEEGPTAALLTEVLGMARIGDHPDPEGQGHVHRFAMGPGGAGAELHLAVQPGLPQVRQGAGGVHHLALRTPDPAGLSDWAARLRAARVAHSGEIERYYFRSLYFREPAGVLFEIATDSPGFAVDEPMEALGARLSLPPFLEPRREAIEAGLKPLD